MLQRDLYDVYLDDTFVGYAWAYGPEDAIWKTVGQVEAESNAYTALNTRTGDKTRPNIIFQP